MDLNNMKIVLMLIWKLWSLILRVINLNNNFRWFKVIIKNLWGEEEDCSGDLTLMLNWKVILGLRNILKILNLKWCGKWDSKIHKWWCNWCKLTQEWWIALKSLLVLISWMYKSNKWKVQKKKKKKRRRERQKKNSDKKKRNAKEKRLKKQLCQRKKKEKFSLEKKPRHWKLKVMTFTKRNNSIKLSHSINKP